MCESGVASCPPRRSYSSLLIYCGVISTPKYHHTIHYNPVWEMLYIKRSRLVYIKRRLGSMASGCCGLSAPNNQVVIILDQLGKLGIVCGSG